MILRNYFNKITRRKMSDFLKGHATDLEVLDIGCGSSAYYHEFFPNRVSLDVDKNNSPDIVADVHDLPMSSDSVNMIICIEILEHLRDPQKAISEMYRVLVPGGKMILTTRFLFPIHTSNIDYFRFTKYGLKELFKKWNILEIVPEAGSMESMAVLIQRMIFQVKFKWNKIIKMILLLNLWVMMFLQKFVSAEYGDIKHEKKDAEVFSSGYYLVLKK